MAKPGLDGHDRGAKIIARALRDAGMEVIYTGLHQTPEQIVETVLQEDADAVGLSILSGAHMTLVPRVVELLREQDAGDVVVTVGGTIPSQDIPELKELGVAEVFTPGRADAGDHRLHQGRGHALIGAGSRLSQRRSPSVSSTSSAPTASRRLSTVRTPKIAYTGNGWCSTHASATWFAVAPTRSATTSARRRRSRLASLPRHARRRARRRAARLRRPREQRHPGAFVPAGDRAVAADSVSGQCSSFCVASDRWTLLQQKPSRPWSRAYSFASSIRAQVQLDAPKARSARPRGAR